jgi:Zn-dependent protease
LILIHSDLIDQNFLLFLVLVGITVFALLTGIGFHEACHAYAATALGDDLPRRQGRTTLNPLAHLDPFGSIMILLIGFGFGKPVQFNPYNLNVSPKTASFIVGAAGPLSNFVMAGILAIPIQLGLVPYINPMVAMPELFWDLRMQDFEDYAGLFLTGAVYLNCILGVFNFLPIPPLDGFKVALFVLPDDLAHEFSKLDQYGYGILLVVIFGIPFLTGYSPLSDIMYPAVRWMVHLFTGVGI